LRPVLRIGHRGAAGHAPENTLRAIETGISLGADFLEFDVQRTLDGALVVMHDKRVDRTTKGTGTITGMTLSEIRRLDAGQGERVPELSEVLRAANGRAGLMIEIITPAIGLQVRDAVMRSNFRGPVIYASFLHTEMRMIRETDSDASTLALLEGVPTAGAQFALDAGVTHVGLAFDSITQGFVAELHAAGLTVFVYTLNDAEDIALARALGVDGIISDFPDRLWSSAGV
jgi:glycerophosphoryl diester phosphodiesterase